jgi:uncharacterized protein (TIGR02285 family)
MSLWRNLCLIMLLPAWQCAAEDQLDWFVQDVPPINIRSGPFAGQGVADRWIAKFSEQLPQFSHHIVESSFARAWHEIAVRDGICIAGTTKSPEREHHALFSDPLIGSTNMSLITERRWRADFAAMLNGDGQIDLNKLPTRPDLALGMASQRALPPVIDQAIHGAAGNRRIETLPNEAALFSLLAAGRIDFLFGSEIEAEYFGAVSGLGDRLVAFEVAGTARNIAVYVACSDQPVGRAAIGQINLLLKDRAFGDSIQAIARHWRPEPNVTFQKAR